MTNGRRWTDKAYARGILFLVAIIVIIIAAVGGWQTREATINLEHDQAPLRVARVLRAEQIAHDIWGEVCDGNVAVHSANLEGDLAGQSSWSIDDRGRFHDCVVLIAPRGPGGKRWPWKTLCTIVVHEIGHLAGHEHSSNPRSVMFPRCTKKNVPRKCMV